MKPAINALDVKPNPSWTLTEPKAGVDPLPFTAMGPRERRSLDYHFGLTQIGVAIEILPPGSRSSLRHWHTHEDEFLMMLEGTLVLVTDEKEQIVGAGMVVGFKAAEENGHHLINRSDAPAKYLVMSSRMEEDAPIYPDDDVKWFEGENGEGYAAHKDGTRY
jgi:uncharacterized cupin superfamily protein